MKILGNIFWFILIGLWSAIGFCVAGLLWCITIIGIPFGVECFKIASLVILPFGQTPVLHPEKHIFANIIWLILFGIEQFLGYMIAGLIFCITIIGIPFGLQCFKLAKLGALPFGANLN